MTTDLATRLAIGPVLGVAATVPVGEVAPEDVSPGVLGFLATLVIVVACIPLFRSMTSKVRGVQYRDRATGTRTSVGAARAGAGSDPALPVGAPPTAETNDDAIAGPDATPDSSGPTDPAG